jgi:hypothetical protein
LWHPGAFTLIEVLVVVGIVATLVSILLPGLSAAREQARAVVCRSNIRQVILANGYYKEDYRGVYCPGASDFLRNLHRWHGEREHPSQPFDPTRGPLVPFLGSDGAIRQCPTFPADQIAAETGGFERGNGGYGYNNDFVGVQLIEYSSGDYVVLNDRAGTLADRIRRPAETIMFTDTAFAASGLIEYSFAESRFHPQYPGVRGVPSIHFRHRKQASVGWCDAHVDAHPMTYTEWNHLYRADPERFGIGWFGEADDNQLFDLK